MHKTVYIEKDEEITSIISKIKRESEREIFLVVPKGALLSQGVINLKLLKKEVDRLEKDLFIITDDEKVKKVTAKVGLKISDFNSGEQEKKSDLNLEIFSERASQETLNGLNRGKIEEREIGSSSFFEKKETETDKREAELAKSDFKEFNSGDLRRMLYRQNERKSDFSDSIKDFSVQKKKSGDFFGKEASLSFQNSKKNYFNGQFFPEGRHLKVHENNSDSSFVSRGDKDFRDRDFLKAQKFFSQKEEVAFPEKKNSFFSSKEKSAVLEKKRSGKFKWFLALFLVLGLISLSGWIYWNWPKVIIKLYPRSSKIEGNIEVQVVAEGDYVPGNSKVKGNYHEFIVEKTIEVETTGTGTGISSRDGKATGVVVILNKYSQASQGLVATTRLLSKEGKLFRLVGDVTVPGMKGDEPGKVEATVIADKAGEDFNIGPSTFTIEGFKGSPKYEKFEVSSIRSMEGGGMTKEKANKRIVSQKDIDSARIKAMDEIGKNLGNLVEEKIGTKEKYFLESAGKEITEAFADHRLNEEADKFSFTVKEKIKLIGFSEQEIKDLVDEKIRQDVGENFLSDKNKIFINYDRPVIDWNKKTMDVMVSYNGFAVSKVEIDNIKNEIKGKNEEQIKSFLMNLKQIEKANLEYNPAWSGRWPVLERNLSIIEAEN